MKAGQFNIHDYLERLYENAEGGQLPDKEGMIIPEENQKTYQWLKKEYHKAQTEVKVEINMGGAKFEPGYDLQTDLKSVKEFKPGMFGEVKTSDTESDKKSSSLDAKKQSPDFKKGEGESSQEEKTKKSNYPETKDKTDNIKDKEEKEETDTEDKFEDKEGKTKVKKLDLKTKKDDDKK